MGFSILQWNANSLVAHVHELKHYLDSIPSLPDIICVQETFLKPTLDINILGYTVIRQDGKNGRGGVATFIRNGTIYSDVQLFENIEGVSVLVESLSGPIRIFNFYISPSSFFDESFFSHIFEQDQIIVCGDFNAKSTLWGSPKADSRGKSLENILQKTDVVVLNTGSPTRYFKQGYSHIDLSFSSPNIANLTNWEVLEKTCGSDHNLVQLDLSTYICNENTNRPRWVYSKADWPLFSALCDKNLAELDLDDELEELNESITEAIIMAAEASIPTSSGKGKKRHAYFWNEKCSIAVKDRDRAKRALKVDSPVQQFVEYKKLKALATKTIKTEKRKSWRSFCSSLSHRTKLSKVWNVIKNLNNKNKSSLSALKTEKGEFAKTDFDKANVLGNHYSKISSTSNYTERFRKHKEEFESKNANIFCHRTDNSSVLNLPFKMGELKKALKKCKNTTPGQDRLSYEMFKHMSDYGQNIVLGFYNRIWEKGYIPKAWRHALVVPILKPNKIKTDPASYRPIALTSNFCKLMERMIVKRMNWFLEKYNLLNKFQSGFRKGRNTIDQLLRLSDTILKSLANKSFVLAVFFDFEKAYDMVWREAVLYKLNNLGVDGNLFNWISVFLENRTFQVSVGSSTSKSFRLENGLPQGSVISPVLFLVAINDLCPTNVHFSLFADDTAVWKSGRNLKFLQKQIQQTINYIQNWCENWGFKISVVKTKFMVFRKGKGSRIELKLNGQQIEQVKNFKFLGMVFDQTFSWKDHIQYVIDKCLKRINILKLLSGSKWGADKNTMVILYKTLIRSIIDYGSIIYQSASKSNLHKLDVIQSQALRICCGALRCTPVEALEVDCGVIPLQLRRRFLSIQAAIKYVESCDNPGKECFQDCYQLYYGRYDENFKPLVLKVQDIASHFPKPFISPVVDTLPPWEYEHAIFDTDLSKILNKSMDNCHYMLSASLEHMSKYYTQLHVFTDGSKMDHRTACAFYIPYIKHHRLIRLPDNTNIFTAEMAAILEALQFILSKPPMAAVIFTDSLSAVQALEIGEGKNALHLEIKYCLYQLSCQGVQVTISWIPSHVGIRGNERVDDLAKEALLLSHVNFPIAPDISDLDVILREQIKREWQTQWDMSLKGRFYYALEPKVSETVKYSDPCKAKQTCISRLRFNKCLLGDTEYMLNKRDSPLCKACKVKEDVSHFLLDCIEYTDLQVTRNDHLIMIGLIPTIQSLLGNDNSYGPLWSYICESNKVL